MNEPASLDAVTLCTADLGSGLAFYDAVFGAIGLRRLSELVDEEEDDAPVEAVGWGPPDGSAAVWLVTGAPATVGVHLRFRAPNRAAVEAFYAAAGPGGGHAAPRRWTLYRRGEYSSAVHDPAGNVLEAVADE